MYEARTEQLEQKQILDQTATVTLGSIKPTLKESVC